MMTVSRRNRTTNLERAFMSVTCLDSKPAARSSHFLKKKWEMERKEVNRKTEFVMLHLRRGNCFEAENKSSCSGCRSACKRLTSGPSRTVQTKTKTNESVWRSSANSPALQNTGGGGSPTWVSGVEAQASQLTASIQK